MRSTRGCPTNDTAQDREHASNPSVKGQALLTYAAVVTEATTDNTPSVGRR